LKNIVNLLSIFQNSLNKIKSWI